MLEVAEIIGDEVQIPKVKSLARQESGSGPKLSSTSNGELETPEADPSARSETVGMAGERSHPTQFP